MVRELDGVPLGGAQPLYDAAAAEIRVGRDLLVALHRVQGPAPTDGCRPVPEWHAQAYDGDGNYLVTVAVARGEVPADLLTAAVGTARTLYPSRI